MGLCEGRNLWRIQILNIITVSKFQKSTCKIIFNNEDHSGFLAVRRIYVQSFLRVLMERDGENIGDRQ